MAVIYQGAKPMPVYQSAAGERVRALQIKTVADLVGGAALVPEDDSYSSVTADFRWIEHQKPQPGGDVVQHDGDRWSYSAAAVFESGFALVDGT